MKKLTKYFTLVSVSLVLFACHQSSHYVVYCEPEGSVVAQIPSDAAAADKPTPQVTPKTILPGANVSLQSEDGNYYVEITMSGVQDGTGWLTLKGTNFEAQNVWVTIDGKEKGIFVENLSQGKATRVAPSDIIFLVDNSGSMHEEADAVARDIINWSSLLTNQGLDVQFGCVGFDGRITGAFDMGSAMDLSTYLNQSVGTYRTHHFDANASTIEQRAGNYAAGPSQEESGMAALRYADDNLSFRPGANRVYIQFTDEPNQPHNKAKYSVEYLNPANANWTADKGTVHTIWSSGDTTASYYTYWRYLYEERPWQMSQYTGGTVQITNSSFTGVSLPNLPVTAALLNSYKIYLGNLQEFMDDKPHQLAITIVTEDRRIVGRFTLPVTFREVANA